MHHRLLTLAAVIFVLAPGITMAREQVTFHEAVGLALKNAKAVNIARADARRAEAGLEEARKAYVPQVVLGSGAGYTFGFPLGTPSIFNVVSTSILFNPAQKEYIRAGRFQIQASDLELTDKRQQTILDTALAYADLERHLAAMDVFKAELAAARGSADIVQQRVKAGVEPEVDFTRAGLAAARVHLKYTQIQADTDLLRLRLSQLTGLPAVALDTVPDSMPALPAPPEADVSRTAVAQNPAVKAADNDALAKDRTAEAERKQLYPQLNLVGQYALFSNALNNYSSFYKNFQSNNGAVGVEFKFPFFNLSQRAKYHEAEADAAKAHEQAADARDQITSETIRLQHAVQQLAAARDVAELEYKLAQSDSQTAQARQASAQSSPRDIQDALMAEQDKRAALLDANFDYQQARLQLLRAAGEIEGWAKAGGSPAP